MTPRLRQTNTHLLDSIDIPLPSQLWVLLDQDERSIDDGFFITDPDGRLWEDFPVISSARHNYTFGLNFADGHSCFA